MSTLSKEQKRHVAAGRHPMGFAWLFEDRKKPSCRECVHARRHTRANSWWKCHHPALKLTGGRGTDIRVRWPACAEFVARDSREPVQVWHD